MKRLLSFFILTMLLLVSVCTQAQDRTVTGKVTDSVGNGLNGATITAKGTRIAVQSTADGSFSIKMPSGINRLVISSVGFTTSEVAATENFVSVTLNPGATTNLNE